MSASHRKLPRAALSFALALILAFSFALAPACSRRHSDPDAPTEPPVSPAVTAAPASGGLLRMAMPENLGVGNASYNPLIVNTEEALQLYSLIFEPLIAINEANELVPCLAAKWSRLQGDESVWLVSLREGVLWHSGERLTADDVVFTWQALSSLGGESYYSRSLESILSIEKIDQGTVRVTARSVGLIELYALNFPIIKPDSPAFIGTGAYRVDTYGGETIRLRANSDWWDRTPHIERIDFLARDSNDTALASYSAGQLDLVPTALLSVGRYSEAGVTAVRDYMTQGMETLLFNHMRQPLSRADFRRAIAHGINRSRIITNVYMNRARSCDVPVPPDSWLYNSGTAQLDYDPAAAAALLSGESLGYTPGEDGLLYSGSAPLALTLLVSGTKENTTRSDSASAIAAQLAELGITVNIVVAAHSYGDGESEFMTALRAKDWDIALVGFNLAQSNDLAPYLSSDGANNFGGFPGTVFRDSLTATASARDDASLRAAFYELQTLFTEQLPFLVLYFRLNSVVCTASLNGMTSLREPALLRNIKNWYFSGE